MGNNLLKFYEFSSIHISGLIVTDYSFDYSHWNADDSLGNWLKKNNIPGIYCVDTRALTKRLREKGTMLGRIICNKQDIEFYDPNQENRFPSETGF